MDFETYKAHDAENFSGLKHFQKSAKSYYYHKHNPGKDTPALRRGRALHVAALEPHRYPDLYAYWPGTDRRTKAGKDAYAKLKAEAGARELLTHDEHQGIWSMAASLTAHPIAGRYLAMDGEAEKTILWSCNGIDCKSLIDKLVRQEHLVVDLKSARDAGSFVFGRHATSYLYHVQMAFYLDAVRHAEGVNCRAVIIAVEPTPPYSVAVYSLPEDVIEAGRRLYMTWLETLKECRRTNTYPDIEDGKETDLQIAPWAMPHESLELTIGGRTVDA